MKTKHNNILRTVGLTAALWAVVLSITISTRAATTLEISVDGLIASHEQANGVNQPATWTPSDNQIVGSATTSHSSSCGNTTYTHQGGILTLQNSKYESARLYFDYAVEGNGTVQIDSDTTTGEGAFSKILAKNESITVNLTSKNEEDGTTKVFLRNISLTPINNISVTFTPVSGIEYKVGSTTVSETTGALTLSGSNTTAYTITASNANYHFVSAPWKTTDENGSVTASGTLTPNVSGNVTPTDTCTITPMFVYDDNGIAPFRVGSTNYWSWETAFAAGVASTIILTDDYLLPQNLSGNGLSSNGTYVTENDGKITYTIPSTAQLLIPYDDSADDGTFSSIPDATKNGGGDATGANRVLTLNAGTNVTVNGAMNVNAKVRTFTNRDTGCVSGKYGQVILSDKTASITVNGSLYCYGYITGSGTVTAKPNASVYELLQLRDWVGGSTASEWAATSFPFSQYYVQNIEATYSIEGGATSYCTLSIYVASLYKNSYQDSIPFIGSNEGLFRIPAKSSLVRKYDATEDRINYTVNGTAYASSMSVKVNTGIVNKTLNSASYVMGLNNRMSMTISSTGYLYVSNDFKLLPGAELTIDEGGIVEVQSGAKVYIYDEADWYSKYTLWANWTSSANDIFAGHEVKNQTVKYSPTRGAATKTNSGSAKLTVNGTLKMHGNVFTTAGSKNKLGDGATILDPGSADKVITGTGKIENYAAWSTGSLTETNAWFTEASDNYEATINTIGAAVKLAGHSGTYASVAAGTAEVPAIYYGTGDYWYQHVIYAEGGTVTVTDSNGVKGEKSPLDDRTTENAVARVANGGAITFAVPEGYSVTLKDPTTATLSGNTLSNVTKDSTLVVTCNHTGGTANCVDKAVCSRCGEAYGEVNSVNHKNFTTTKNDDGTYTVRCSACGVTETVTAPVSLAAIQLSAEAEVVLRLKVTTDSSFSGTIVLTEEPNEVAKNENETTYTVANGVISGVKTETANNTTRYVLEQGIAAGEMTGDVTIEVFDSNGTRCYVYDYKTEGITSVLTRTVVDYVDLALASDNAKLIELVKRMAIYGGYAQQHFGVDTSNLAYSKLSDLTALKAETEALAADSIADNVTWSEVSAAAVAMLLGTEPEETEHAEIEETVEATEPTEATEATEPEVTEPTESTVPETTEAAEPVGTEPTATEVVLEGVREITPNVMNSGAVAEETEPAQTAPPAQNFMLELTAIETEAAEETTIEETVPAETTAVETVPEETAAQETEPLESIPEETIAEETVPKTPVLFEETLVAETPSSILLNDGTTVSSLNTFGLEYYKQSVVLDSRIALKTSFRMSSQDLDLSQYTFHLTYAKGGVAVDEPKLLTVTSENVVMDTDDTGTEFYKCVVKIEDIPVAYWDFDYIITITDTSGNSYALQTSVLAWVKECINAYTAGKTTLKQANMAKAMYFYNQAANNYFEK